MKLAIFLVIIFAWIYKGESSPALNRSNMTGVPVKNETTSSTVSPFVTTHGIRSTSESNASLNQDNVNRASPGDSWFGRNSSIPIIALACIVLVLVLVIIVLSVIIVINRKRLYRIKRQQAPKASPPPPQESPQIPQGSNNETCEDVNQNPTTEVFLGVFSSPEGETSRNASLKYDQPYAHQKPLTDMIKNIMKTKQPTTQAAQHPPRQSEFYLAPHDVNSSTITYSGNSANDDELSSSNSVEYQVPRNAKKRAGLLTRDLSVKNSADDTEYVVMMGDEKAESKSRKESKKGSVKDTLKRIPQNFAKSKIKLFQDKTTSQKALSTASKGNTDERPQYDVSKGVK